MRLVAMTLISLRSHVRVRRDEEREPLELRLDGEKSPTQPRAI